MSKKTVSQIVRSGNDYLISLKGNSKALFKGANDYISTHRATQRVEQREASHGRREYRCVRIWQLNSEEARAWLPEGWESVRTLIYVGRRRRHRSCRGRVHCSSAEQLYITSHAEKSAAELGALVRAHWGIENRLHWVKDAIQQEDRNGIGSSGGALALSLVKTIALNLLRSNGYDSVKHGTIALANKIQLLRQMICRT